MYSEMLICYHIFTDRMSTYPDEIEEFLYELSERAEERNLDDFNSRVYNGIGLYWREPGVAARVRATKQKDKFQTKNTKQELALLRDDEIRETFDTILCVTLQLGFGGKHSQGHFYPIRIPTLVQNFCGKKHDDGQLQLTLPFDEVIPQRRIDDVEFALQTGDDGEEDDSDQHPYPDIIDDIYRN